MNLSFPKDMRGYSQKDIPSDSSNNLLKEPLILLNKIPYNIEDQYNMCANLLEQINSIYSEFPNKEIGDARIYLAHAKHCLNLLK